MAYTDRTNDRPNQPYDPNAPYPPNAAHPNAPYQNVPYDVSRMNAGNPIVEYHDRVRWGPIVAGIFVAIAAQLLLSALGASIGLTIGSDSNDPGAIGLGVGIWSIISLFIALFLGSWLMASTCGPMTKKTAMLNGAILWATTIAVSLWLLASGISGTFGIIASNAGEVFNQVQEPGGVAPTNPGAAIPDITSEQAQQYSANAARAAWSFLFGALLGLVAALIGATVGARKPRIHT